MTLPTLFRRLLSRLRFGRSPQQVTPRVDGSAVYRGAPVIDEDETRRVPRAVADHIHRGVVNGFPRKGAEPRILPGRAEVPDGNGDVFDRNSGNHHLRRFL